MKWYLEAGSCEQGSGSIKGEESWPAEWLSACQEGSDLQN
jgi:hypothetical protein